MGVFDDVLEEVGVDPTDRTAIAEFVKKYPALDAAVLRQKDYSKRLNEFKAKEVQFKEADEAATAWENWQRENWDGESKMTKQQKAALSELQTANERVAQLQQGQGAEMTFDQIQADLQKNGYVTKTDVQALAKELKLASTDDIGTGLGNQAKAFEHIFVKTTPYLRKFEREFGEDMDFEAFYKTIATPEGIADIPGQYERFVSDKRAAKRVADADAKVKDMEKIVEQKRTEANSVGQPTDNGGSPLGHLQASKIAASKSKASEEVADTITAPLGSGTIASIAAAEYLKNKGNAA